MKLNPKHVAIIMDGNGRWAQSKGRSRLYGHQVGSKVIKRLVEVAIEHQVLHLTIFALSCDNTARPLSEVQGLIALFKECIQEYLSELVDQGVRLIFIGDTEGLDPILSQLCLHAQEETKDNTRLVLTIALNFSGQWHIIQTAKHLIANGRELSDEEIDQAFSNLLPSNPDLLIRTGGEQRLSDFVMYHLGYTELFFLDVKWPEFNESHLTSVLANYATRDRRFGQI